MIQKYLNYKLNTKKRLYFIKLEVLGGLYQSQEPNVLSTKKKLKRNLLHREKVFGVQSINFFGFESLGTNILPNIKKRGLHFTINKKAFEGLVFFLFFCYSPSIHGNRNPMYYPKKTAISSLRNRRSTSLQGHIPSLMSCDIFCPCVKYTYDIFDVSIFH